MYSVIEIGGFQHKVTAGETVKLAKFEAEVGSDVKVSDILLVSNGDKIEVGAPTVPNSSVTLEVLSHGKDDKIKIFKRKRRKGYRKTAGHRQQYTEVLVKEIASDSGKDSVDNKFVDRVRARVAALAKQKLDAPKLSGKKAVKVEAPKAEAVITEAPKAEAPKTKAAPKAKKAPKADKKEDS